MTVVLVTLDCGCSLHVRGGVPVAPGDRAWCMEHSVTRRSAPGRTRVMVRDRLVMWVEPA